MRPRPTDVAVILALFTVLALAFSWPLPMHPGSAYLYQSPTPDPITRADTYLTTWILGWGEHQLRHDPRHLFDANILWPLPDTLALSESMLAAVLLFLPLDLVHHAPVLANNLLWLATFALGGTGAALLVLDLGGSTTAAVVGGALFAFHPLRMAQLGHVQALATHWMPFALLGLQRLLRTGSRRAAVGFALCLLLEALSSVYHLYYFGLGVIAFLVAHAAWRCPTVPGTYRRAVGLGLLVALLLIPTMLPYGFVKERFVLARSPLQTVMLSAIGEHYLGALLTPLAYLRMRYLEGRGTIALVGFGTFLLLALGTRRGAAPTRGGRRMVGCYLTFALALVVLSLGPSMRLRPVLFGGWPGPAALLMRWLPGFDALRVPLRASAGAFLAFSVVAGLGTDALLAYGTRGGRRVAIWGLLALLTIAECWRPRFYAVPAPPTDEALVGWLAAHPDGGPIVSLPLGGFADDAGAMLWSTRHWRPLVNGYASSPIGGYLQATFASFPDARSLRLLADVGVREAIVHRAGASAEQRRLCDAPDVLAAGADGCVVRVAAPPPVPPGPPDRLVPLAGARVTDAAGADADAVHDGDRTTHWVEPVDPATTSWLQVDLPAPHRLTRLVLRLGTHLGEYPRTYRVDTSADGATWTPLVDEPLGTPPLADLLRTPDDLAVEIRLPPTDVRHLRLVRPSTPSARNPLWVDWWRWGAHELELYETSG